MGLSQGMRLGSCEVIELLGTGGMGEVYRGRDMQLGRDVAIKALPDAFAHDADRLARFEREAQVLATLNHPNLAVIHELKEVAGAKYLILELVEGETLTERIARGPMPLDEALDVAKQIAEALEAAHEKGIIHRDLKPANVKITPQGRVKVLDFGLAKIYESAAIAPTLSNSPTLSALQTMGGVILGTAAYMSPEQARGKAVDRRADVWAFGCLLYEMLSDRQTFSNEETVSDTLAGVLRSEPDWSALPTATPPKIRALLQHCLRKDPRRRWSDMAVVRIEIEEAQSEPATAQPAAIVSSRRREYVWAAIALVFVATTIAIAARHFLERAPEAPTVRFDVFIPEADVTSVGEIHLSPDGRKLAFAGRSGTKNLIWIRPLDSSSAESLPSSEGVKQFFWSADSQQIGFFTTTQLKRIAASGGPATVICNLPAANDRPSGGAAGSWNSDGVILFGRATQAGEQTRPILRVSAAGGQQAPETEVDTKRNEVHAFPNFLPDGRHYFYLSIGGPISARAGAAYIGTLGSKERHALPGIVSSATYSSGHMIFIREGALLAQPFDINRLEPTGDPVTLVDTFAGLGQLFGPFSVSRTGTLAYRVAADPSTNTRFVWFDRAGKQLAVAGPPGEYGQPDLSPDGRSVAFQRGNPAYIWVLDLERNVSTRITSNPGRDTSPVWSPDSRKIAFDSIRESRNGRSLFEREVDVVGEDKLLLKIDGVRNMSDWSGDGRYLVYEGGNDIWALPYPVSSDTKPVRITETPFTESAPKVSPDGRWIAYESNESGGLPEIYIQSFPQPGFKKQASTKGGIQPNWGHDGKELFYIAPDSTLMAVSIKATASSMQLGVPTTLFKADVLGRGNRQNYNVAANGRFLFNIPVTEQASAPITVILNWASNLKK
jgi:eukaryotic-like serine/threonine-protein kinase